MSPQKSISHFELLNKLGEGGMGTVYKARDIRLDRTVALKFLSSTKSVESPEEQARFCEEGRALSALSHPHVATVYEVDEMDGVPFLALEYLAGGTLRSRIRAAGGQLPVPSILNWAVDLAEGLAHVHRHGVVHCDVKSTNVMFDSEGRVKLTDFGLAKRSHTAESQTAQRNDTTSKSPSQEEKVEGTLGYMAPEQLQGKGADSRSDLFSFGVLLYEMATGQLPFRSKSESEIIQRVLSLEPRPLRLERADLPEGLEKIVGRLLEKRPEDRFARAMDVADALRALQTTEPGEAPTKTVIDIGPVRGKFSRRWWLVAALCLMTVAAWLNADWLRRWVWRSGLPDRKNIAVLPFRNIGGDAGQLAFCDGLTETLTTALTKHGGFSVVPVIDARKLESSVQARREFGVNLVITGSVLRRADEVRVYVTLIDAVTQRQIEAEPVNWPVNKLFEMEDAVLAKISDLLNVSGLTTPFVAGASQFPGAYDAYLRGRGYLYRYDKPGNLDRAREQFEMAIQQDNRFVLAYVGLADVQRNYYRLRNDVSNLESARLAAARAVELNPRLAGGHISMGAMLADLQQPDKAVAELDLALKLDPRDPAAYRELGGVYRSQKRFREAEQVYLQAITTRPGDWLGYSSLGVFYASQQRYTDGERMFRKVIELTPDNHLGYRLAGSMMFFLGRNLREVEEMYRKAISLKPTGRSYSNLGALYMFHERYREAVPVMEKAVELSAQETPGDYLPHGNLGDAYQLSGSSMDKAKEAWRQALGILETRLKSKPDDAELLVFRGLFRAKIGDTMTAVQDAERAVLLAPGNATVRFEAGLAFAVAGSGARAMEEIAAAVRSGYSAEEIRRAPELGGFHGNPVFEQLLIKPAPR